MSARLAPATVLLALLILGGPAHAQIGNLGPIGREGSQGRKGNGGGVKFAVAIQPAIGSFKFDLSSEKTDVAGLSLGLSADILRSSLAPAVAAVLRAGGLISGTFLTKDPGGAFVDRFEEFSAILGPEVALQLGGADMPVVVSPFVGIGVGPSYERLLSPRSQFVYIDSIKKLGFVTGWRLGVDVAPRAMPIAFSLGIERHSRDFDYGFYSPFAAGRGKSKLKHSSAFLAIRFILNQ